jgi:AraC-like DNA-binding protein
MLFGHSEKFSGVRGWQQAVSAAYFPLAAEGRNRGDFRGELDIWNLGAVSATRIACDAVLYRREAAHLREERESSLLISVPSRAEVTFRQNGQQAKCAPGGFVIERSDAPYEYWHAKPDVQWVVKVPRESVQARIGGAERTLALSVDARSGLAAYFLSSLRVAVTHAPDLPERSRAVAGAHLLDILCLALRADARALNSAESGIRRAHLHRAEAFIDDHLREPSLTPEAVAMACGISVRYLQRLFAETGRTISSHIRDCRLSRGDEDLRRGPTVGTVASIAYRWGFSDQSQFSRLYRARYGRSPRETRAARP